MLEDTLSILAQAPAQTVKRFAESLLAGLGEVKVDRNRSGIVMLPHRDTAKGSAFYIGEILIAEAFVTLTSHDAHGYGACLGRDTEQALAVAVLDAALRSQLHTADIFDFVEDQRRIQRSADFELRKSVEETKVEMETF